MSKPIKASDLTVPMLDHLMTTENLRRFEDCIAHWDVRSSTWRHVYFALRDLCAMDRVRGIMEAK